MPVTIFSKVRGIEIEFLTGSCKMLKGELERRGLVIRVIGQPDWRSIIGFAK